MPRDLRDYHYKGPRFNRDQGAIGPIHDPWNLYHENTPPFGYTLNSLYNPNNPYRQLPGIRRFLDTSFRHHDRGIMGLAIRLEIEEEWS
jgi:hypothetical protein